MRLSNTKRKANKSVKTSKASHALRQMNHNAAGIDIGSREHYVAVPPERSDRPVRNFGCLTPDVHELAKWLKECEITTVVMQSTAVSWIPIMEVLESYKFDVVLVDARACSNTAKPTSTKAKTPTKNTIKSAL